jgi:hypothetical protein
MTTTGSAGQSYDYAPSSLLLGRNANGKYYVCGTANPCTGGGGGGGGVTTVFTRTGAVVAATGDYTAAQVTNAADLSSANQQTFTGAIKTPAILIGTRLASTLSGDGQSIITQADNGQIPIVPGHILSWITDTAGAGHGAGDSGLDVTTVCTSGNGKCTTGHFHGFVTLTANVSNLVTVIGLALGGTCVVNGSNADGWTAFKTITATSVAANAFTVTFSAAPTANGTLAYMCDN